MDHEIDDLDRGIIKLLSKDGRMSFTELAGHLKVTEKTIRLRYKNLIDQEIIEVVGVVNPIALGLKAGAIIQLKVSPQHLQKVISQLKTITEIRFVTLTSGPYPLLAQVNVRNQEDITSVIMKIGEFPDITEINSMVQLEVYKNSFEYI